jgi:hypothetical protein
MISKLIHKIHDIVQPDSHIKGHMGLAIYFGMAITVCTVDDRILGDFPSINTVNAPHIYGSGQPYIFLLLRQGCILAKQSVNQQVLSIHRAMVKSNVKPRIEGRYPSGSFSFSTESNLRCLLCFLLFSATTDFARLLLPYPSRPYKIHSACVYVVHTMLVSFIFLVCSS